MKVLFIERRPYSSTSIERVFAQVGKDLRAQGVEVEFQQLPFRSKPLGIIGNLLFFKPRRADIFHITGEASYMVLRLPRMRTVVTIHDLIGIHTRQGLRRRIIKWVFAGIAAKRARWITAISQATKDELCSHYEWLRSIVRVIENPLIDGFVPKPNAIRNVPPTVLQIGTASNKNLPMLIEALRGLDCRLRIVGPLDPELLQKLEGSNIDFSSAENVNDSDIVREFEKADVIAFCSTYEGFGLPIIEGQAVGRPVVTSDIPPMADIAGKGAIFVDPLSAESIRIGIQQALSDTSERASVIAAGFDNVKRFRGTDIAARYADLYREVLGAE